MKRYPEYKESDVAWIGEIPARWNIGKIKHIATFVSQKSTPETNAIKISPESETYDGHQLRKCIDYFCHLVVKPEAYSELVNDDDFANTDTSTPWSG